MNDKLGEPWQVKSLEQVSTFRRGSFPQPYGNPEWYDDNGYPFVQVYDINQNNKLNSRTKSRISEEASKKSVFIEKGSLIVSIQGSIGRVAITQYDAFVDRTILIFNDFEKYLDKQFFLLIIKELFLRQGEIADGGVIKTITKQTLKNFKIKIPPLPEQKKIAEIISGFDRLINLKVQKLNKSKIFSFPLVDKLLSSNDLEFVSLSDIAEIVRGKFSHRPRNDPDFYGGNYPFIQTGDVPKDELFIGSHSQTLNERGLSVSRLFPEGTLTITIAATIAEVGILKYPACFPDSIVGITPKLNKCNVVYLFYIIKKLKEELKSLAPQSAQSNLNLEILNAFKIPLPSLDVQHKISKLIKCSLENIELQKKDIHKLKVIKNGLSHDLLSGRKRMTT